MASDHWQSARPLTVLALRLAREGRQFDFVQAVRLIEWASSGAARVGYLGPASKEPVRFAAHPSLAFPCADIESISVEVGDSDAMTRYLITVNFMGLLGPASPLPPFYTLEVLRDETNAVRDFLDFFNHRLISLFYRACTKYRLGLDEVRDARERGDGIDAPTDVFPQMPALPEMGPEPVATRVGVVERGPAKGGVDEVLFSLIGLRGAVLRRAGSVDWSRLLPFAGLLTMRAHSAPVLANILSHYFDGIPVQIRELVGRWVAIPEDQQARLGRPSCRLIDERKRESESAGGEAAVIGARVADVAGKIRVILGPLSFHRFVWFLPGGGSRRPLYDLVRFLVSDQLDFDVELRLRGTRVPPLRLGSERCRLARSTWLNDFPERKARCASLVLGADRLAASAAGGGTASA